MLDDNLKQFDAVTARQRAIYERKNHDYGDSFSESLDEWGPVAFAVRADDKMHRIKQLINHSALVENESLMDTISDLANYCVMFLIWKRAKWDEVDDPDSTITCQGCGKAMFGGRIGGLRICSDCHERGEWGP